MRSHAETDHQRIIDLFLRSITRVEGPFEDGGLSEHGQVCHVLEARLGTCDLPIQGAP